MALRVVAWDDTTDHFVRTTADPSDILPGSGTGGAIPDIVAAGSETVSAGVNSKAITFTTAFSNTSYAIIANMVNLTDSSVQYQPITITNKTNSGFTASWNALTDSANYLVDYIAVTPCSSFRSNVEDLAQTTIAYTDSLLSADGLAICSSFFNDFDSTPFFQPTVITAKSSTEFTTNWTHPLDTSRYDMNYNALNASCPSFKSGINSVTNNSTSISINFPFPDLTSSSYALIPRFSNTVNGFQNILYQPITITSKSINGFTARWNQPIDSINYKLEWIVYVTN